MHGIRLHCLAPAEPLISCTQNREKTGEKRKKGYQEEVYL